MKERRDNEKRATKVERKKVRTKRRHKRKKNKKGSQPKNKMANCSICFELPIDMVFPRCMHAVCCQKCAADLSACPICRKVGHAVRCFIGGEGKEGDTWGDEKQADMAVDENAADEKADEDGDENKKRNDDKGANADEKKAGRDEKDDITMVKDAYDEVEDMVEEILQEEQVHKKGLKIEGEEGIVIWGFLFDRKWAFDWRSLYRNNCRVFNTLLVPKPMRAMHTDSRDYELCEFGYDYLKCIRRRPWSGDESLRIKGPWCTLKAVLPCEWQQYQQFWLYVVQVDDTRFLEFIRRINERWREECFRVWPNAKKFADFAPVENVVCFYTYRHVPSASASSAERERYAFEGQQLAAIKDQRVRIVFTIGALHRFTYSSTVSSRLNFISMQTA